MISFESDYTEGAHPKVLEKLVETNMVQVPGYGNDIFTASAKEKIRKAINCPEADIYFLVGGTQTNQTVIDSILTKVEGVISADTGHIAVHESGAIEFTGHKVLPLPEKEGKISAKQVRDYVSGFYADDNHEFMVYPGMVYISHPTEYGTLYTKQELMDLYEVCHQYKMSLFLDGARLGYGVASKQTDVTLEDVAKYTDVFYIGGTKVGALCGEAVVFTKNNTPKRFVTTIKQHGALLAKGRLTGVQFDALFTDDLYLKISNHAIELAEKLKKAFDDKGYTWFLKSPTNQQFIVLENSQMEALAKKVRFSFWSVYDENHTVVRFCTSWATKEENINYLIEQL